MCLCVCVNVHAHVHSCVHACAMVLLLSLLESENNFESQVFPSTIWIPGIKQVVWLVSKTFPDEPSQQPQKKFVCAIVLFVLGITITKRKIGQCGNLQ